MAKHDMSCSRALSKMKRWWFISREKGTKILLLDSLLPLMRLFLHMTLLQNVIHSSLNFVVLKMYAILYSIEDRKRLRINYMKNTRKDLVFPQRWRDETEEAELLRIDLFSRDSVWWDTQTWKMPFSFSSRRITSPTEMMYSFDLLAARSTSGKLNWIGN